MIHSSQWEDADFGGIWTGHLSSGCQAVLGSRSSDRAPHISLSMRFVFGIIPGAA